MSLDCKLGFSMAHRAFQTCLSSIPASACIKSSLLHLDLKKVCGHYRTNLNSFGHCGNFEQFTPPRSIGKYFKIEVAWCPIPISSNLNSICIYMLLKAQEFHLGYCGLFVMAVTTSYLQSTWLQLSTQLWSSKQHVTSILVIYSLVLL